MDILTAENYRQIDEHLERKHSEAPHLISGLREVLRDTGSFLPRR